jgi:hypothetical protein
MKVIDTMEKRLRTIILLKIKAVQSQNNAPCSATEKHFHNGKTHIVELQLTIVMFSHADVLSSPLLL